MCGIAGFYGFKDESLIKKFSDQLKHRGPDGDGYYLDENVSLLSRRLAIIDVKGGDQPIYNEDKSVVVVYNGEIYNYLELRQELETAGHTFTTQSDTETIVHGYEEWGLKFFDRLNAMFGIALYDKKKEKLILVRDHFGIKPLYFITEKATDGKIGKLIFSSEIKPLIENGLIEKKANDDVIYRYLKYRIHEDTEQTFFAGVEKLMPGELMIIQNGRIERQSYSQLPKELLSLDRADKSDSTDKFKQILTKAVQRRLVSEVPVGTCLSGGLDSSTVVALVNQLLKDKVKEAGSIGKIQQSFSAVFPNASNNEEKYIDELVDQIKHISDHKVYPKPEEFFQELEDFVRTQEEPTISTGPYAQYKVMEEAHKHVTVVLDGQGADEMMAGYLPYYFVYLRQLRRQGKWGKLIKECFSSIDVLWKYGLIKLMYVLGIKKQISLNEVLNRVFTNSHKHLKFSVTQDNLKKRLVEDIFHNSLPSLLRYEDKNSMRFSIEGRVPFLDFELMRFLFSLDDEAIINNGWNKSILRSSVEGLLPDTIVNRRNKIGFTTPEYDWFMRMKNKIYAIFMSDSFANRPYFNQPAVIKYFQEFIEGKNDDTLLFWRLLNVEMWLRIFFDKQTKLEPKEKDYFEPNLGKHIVMNLNNKKYYRFPVKTKLVAKDDDISEIVKEVVEHFFAKIEYETTYKHLKSCTWFCVISEKIIAISQGRSFFIWDIKPSFTAKLLSRFVKRTPYGIGLGSPWTMQIAINEVGLTRIALAAFASAITKPFGLKGVFYHIAGRTVAAIDGPTEYSLYPSNVSAKLGPKNPDHAAKIIKHALVKQLGENNLFKGVAIIDANDLGRNVLGNASDLSSDLVEHVFKDNPMGQGGEQTPITLVFITD